MTTKAKLIIKLCPRADKEHSYSRRQYAHVGHKRGVICVANDFFDLPPAIQMGLIAHEVGHIMVGYQGTEEDADKAANELFGIKIRYSDFPYGKDLQYLSEHDTIVLRDWDGYIVG